MKQGVSKKTVYPFVIYEKQKGEQYYTVYVPDFDEYTQGEDLAECITMARDLIELMGVNLMDVKKEIPKPFSKKIIDNGLKVEYESIVDVDFESYKKKLANLSVKKNCTIPFWLNEKAESQGINFSKVLQDALLEKISL